MTPLISTVDPQYNTQGEREGAILVGVFLKEKKSNRGRPPNSVCVHDLMDELKALAKSAGARVSDSLVVFVEQFSPSALIGSGKAEEIHGSVHRLDADLVIFYNLLKPGQQRKLEEIVGVKVIDRKELILDIFAQRAKSAEGKMQVELAQLQYRMSRIIGKGLELSRTGGGIGTRGPGEKKLEVDRRRIRERITQIKREMGKVKKTRALHHKRRKKGGTVVVSLVGYTNAGKSTLFNVLTGATEKSIDQMFSTLDPKTRRLSHGFTGSECLLVDTVGFIRELPPELIEAFKATLEGINESDLIIHVIDFSSPFWEQNQAVVESLLYEIGAGEKTLITAFNKIDLQPGSGWQDGGGKLFISAKTGAGIEELKKEIGKHICRFGNTGKNSIRNVY